MDFFTTALGQSPEGKRTRTCLSFSILEGSSLFLSQSSSESSANWIKPPMDPNEADGIPGRWVYSANPLRGYHAPGSRTWIPTNHRTCPRITLHSTVLGAGSNKVSLWPFAFPFGLMLSLETSDCALSEGPSISFMLLFQGSVPRKQDSGCNPASPSLFSIHLKNSVLSRFLLFPNLLKFCYSEVLAWKAWWSLIFQSPPSLIKHSKVN